MNTQNIRTLVDDFVGKLEGAIRAEALDRLNTSLGTLMTSKRPGALKPAASAKPVKARQVETKALSAARKVQGRYLGMLRTATGARRAKAKYIAKEKGVKAALKFLTSSVSKN